MAFEDRKANRPNRFKITPDSGNSYYVTLERADEPTVLGTPVNAENLNRLYSPENKPTAADVGALPLAGGKLTGGLTIESNGGFLQMDDKDSGGSTRLYKNASSTVDYGTYLADTAPDGTRGALIIRARAGDAEKLQLTITNADGTSVDHRLYGEHHKPTAAEIGAVTTDNNRTDIPEGDDLNTDTYLTIGAWRATTVARATSLKNCPVKIAFTMDVVAGTGFHTTVGTNSGYIIQKITTHEGEEYFRRVSAGSNGRVYAAWKTVLNTGNMHLYGIGAVAASVE